MDTLRDAAQALERAANQLQSAAGSASVARTQDLSRYTQSTRDELIAERRSAVNLTDLNAAKANVDSVFNATTPVILRDGSVEPAPARA